MPVVSKAKEVSQQNEPSDESLPLKPAGRQKRQLETQSQSSESEDDSEYPPDTQRVNDFSDEAHKEVVSEPLRERDALDDMIDEAKAVNNLVRPIYFHLQKRILSIDTAFGPTGFL